MKRHAFELIAEFRVIAILRGVEATTLDNVADALCHGGVRCVEITMNTPGASAMIEHVKKTFGNQLLVGAGTVLDTAAAYQAISSGADFILAPTLSIPVIEMCATYGALAVPGAFTPTEILSAWQAGAQLIKVFPVGSVGPGYIKDLLGPLPQIPLLPVGGVNLENAASFRKAGAVAVGVGSALFDPKLARAGDFREITRRSTAFIQAMTQ